MRIERKSRGRSVAGVVALAALLLAAAPVAHAQLMRYLGSITTIDGNTLTVKTDAGDVHQVQVPTTAILKRIAPGQTDLTKADPLDFGSLAVGDRVLVTLDPNITSGTPQAARIIAIKQADVTKKQEAENAEWSQGVHGLVKSVDTATGVIVVTTRIGPLTKDVTVNTTKATVLKRYAPGSVAFDQAQPAPITAIHPGDQLSARGTKNADGTAIAADGVVTGTFRSIPGTVISIDTAASTVTVKDLSTKKPGHRPHRRRCPVAAARRHDGDIARRAAQGQSSGRWRPRRKRRRWRGRSGRPPHLQPGRPGRRSAWILRPSWIARHRFSSAP